MEISLRIHDTKNANVILENYVAVL
jgi:hypothetical protein